MNLDVNSSDQVLGLFENDHCRYNLDIVAEALGHLEPSLAEMTGKAIDMLSSHEQGFFLFVEGGRIDQAHHDTKAHKALDETIEFAKAIAAAVSKTNAEETLIVVSADHGHTMTYAGYGVSFLNAKKRTTLSRISYDLGSRWRHFWNWRH